jgi:hypothetical protein
MLPYPNPDFNPAKSSYQKAVSPPSSDPDVGEQMQVCIAWEWLPYVLGALTQLQNPASWIGTPAEKELAVARATVLIGDIYEPSCVIAASEIPTPYWDEDSDVDDEMSPVTQPWYGTVSDPEAAPAELDFVENAAIWAFTGFLAVATWEIGAAPAILFNTVAPQFVLAVKRGEFAEIIRILVDGQDAVTVDTTPYTEGDVIRTNIVADPAFETHDIMLIQVS